MLMSSGVGSIYASGEQLGDVDFVTTTTSDQVDDMSAQVVNVEKPEKDLESSTIEQGDYKFENEFLLAEKKIHKVSGTEREWEVETSIRKKPLNKNTDIVILLDNSDNMAYNGRF